MSDAPTHTPETIQAAPAPVPTPPTERELAVLRRALEASELPGHSGLLAQLRMLQVAPGSDPTTRIYLLHPDAPRAQIARTERTKILALPVRTPFGAVAGELSVWVDHGHLCALSYTPYHGRRALTLPAPEWLPPVTSHVPARVRVRGAREALTGTRLVLAPPTLPIVAATPPPRLQPQHTLHASSPERAPLMRWAVRVAVVLAAIALAFGAFTYAQRGGADLDAARAAGASAGAEAGALNGFTAGSFAGQVEGELAGYDSTYEPAFNRARASVLRERRAAALERRREAQEAAAAAAAAARVAGLDNRTCAGYRDARGYWICS